jgi:hypothetical protein
MPESEFIRGALGEVSYAFMNRFMAARNRASSRGLAVRAKMRNAGSKGTLSAPPNFI